jgi:hypothetical protein
MFSGQYSPFLPTWIWPADYIFLLVFPDRGCGRGFIRPETGFETGGRGKQEQLSVLLLPCGFLGKSMVVNNQYK